MSSNNPVSDKWAKRIKSMWDWQQGFRGDNVRRSGSSVYVGSAGNDQSDVGTDWRPRQYRVVSEENDYLTSVPFNNATDSAGEKEYKVAKPVDFRGDTERWGVYPAYVPSVSVIWAAPIRNNGATDANGDPILLLDLNFDGRSADGFWAEIGSEVADGTNKWTYTATEQERTSSGFSALADGRVVTGVVNSVENSNDGTGVQGNGIDIDGAVFDDNADIGLRPIQGSPVHWVQRTYDKSTGDPLYTFEATNAIDGECA